MLAPIVTSLSLLSLLVPPVLGVPVTQDSGRDLAGRAASCNVKGHDNGVDAFYYDSTGTQSSSAACSAQCQKRAKCLSFGYGKKVCMLFTVDVASNVEEDSSSPFTYLDAVCVAPASSASSANSVTSILATTAGLADRSTTAPSTSSAISNPSAVTPPTNCPIPTSWTVSYFNWFNSTHNLDCVTGPDIGDGTTCFNSSSDGTTFTCDPSQGPCQNCGVPACYTGLPFQPLGYGPPDKVTITIDGFASCVQTNPVTVHRFQVGEGYVNCGSSANYLDFYGSSNAPQEMGRLDFRPPATACNDGRTYIRPVGTASFPFTCTYDEGRNATCTAAPFEIQLASFTTYTNP